MNFKTGGHNSTMHYISTQVFPLEKSGKVFRSKITKLKAVSLK
ncbi:MAG: hypothetical protein PUH24_06030 [Prevotellaceae bacterium]|nr:hypothetical protein [Prevotellaceae bacterium]MDY6131425.1 hypothetical protein [Prevotella sp.]